MNLSHSFSKENKKKRKRLGKLPAPTSTPVSLLERDDDINESPKKKRRNDENLNEFFSPKKLNCSFSEASESPFSNKKKNRKRKKKKRESESSQILDAKRKEEGDESNDDEETKPETARAPKAKKAKGGHPTIDMNDLTLPPMPAPPPTENHIKLEEDEEMDIQFLKQVLEEVKPSNKSFKVHMNAMDFSKIADSAGISVEACQTRLKALIDRTQKVKPLLQVVQETLALLPFKGKFGTFSRFAQAKKNEIKEGIKSGLGTTEFTVATAIWENLDDEQRSKYRNLPTGKEFGKAPFSLFYENLKSKNSSVTPKEGREKWKALKVEKKVRYIERSMQMVVAQKEELAKGEEITEGNHTFGVRCPRRDEALLYLRHLNFPDQPIKLPSLMYFSQMDMPSNNVLVDAQKMFKDLDEKQQNVWKQKHSEAWKKYEKDVAQWKKNQKNELALTFLKFYKIPESLDSTKAERAGKTKVSKIKSNLARIEMPIGNIKFEYEPPFPPVTPQQLFMLELQKKSTQKITFIEARNQYAKLDQNKRDALKAKVEKIRDKYISGLLEFIENMPIEKRKLFLGVRRERYIKLLRTDIFEEKYPNKDFPVYVRPTESHESPIKQEHLDYGFEDDILEAITPISKKSKKQGNNKEVLKVKAVKKAPETKAKVVKQNSSDESSEKEKTSESQSDDSSSEDGGPSSHIKAPISQKALPKKPISQKAIPKKPISQKAIPQKPVETHSDSGSDDSEEMNSWMQQMRGNFGNREDSDDDEEEEESD